jgi:hypothetical protein
MRETPKFFPPTDLFLQFVEFEPQVSLNSFAMPFYTVGCVGFGI